MDIIQIADHFEELLQANNIQYKRSPFRGGYCFTFPENEELIGGDVCVHRGTYGVNKGHVESYRMPWDYGDVTHCTPEHMVELILGADKSSLEKEEDWDDSYSIYDAMESLHYGLFGR